MQNCQNCGHHFTFKDKSKMIWRITFNNEVHCPDCGKTYYMSSKRVALSYGLLLFIEFIFMLIANLYEIGFMGFIIVLIFLLGIIIFIMPLTMKFVEEPDGLLDRQFREMQKRTKK
ncbi:TIGR04104 family putative zinc finger protein [Macrococcus brunensis]|uniref:TIGR04104 family putative zinc finger protein n=1 Tax=Macrococcus brunensis TaxID=198483 RepID=UPI001EEFE7B4|nr:TIGR04104 family putative zinc finger protein [Macrococcus brunensis]ULG73703.1 hypothetical protein MGG13_08340 [Macrococcus brunensis]